MKVLSLKKYLTCNIWNFRLIKSLAFLLGFNIYIVYTLVGSGYSTPKVSTVTLSIITSS